MIEWNLDEPTFIHNDNQYFACLIALGIVDIDYCPPEAREFFNQLSNKQKMKLKKRINEVKNGLER